jgi:hypothetical protein
VVARTYLVWRIDPVRQPGNVIADVTPNPAARAPRRRPAGAKSTLSTLMTLILQRRQAPGPRVVTDAKFEGNKAELLAML